MKTNKTITKTLVALTALTSQLGSQLAVASVNVNQFTPAVNPAYIYSEDSLMSTVWGAKGKGRPFFSAYYQMINDPLVELNVERTRRRATLIDSMNSLNLAFGYGIAQGIQIGASTSMNLVRLPGEANQFAFGDSRLFSKFRLNSDHAAVSFAFMPELFVPTGNQDLFVSNGGLGAGGRFVVEHDFGPLQMAGNIGYRYLPKAEFRDLDMRQAIPMSLGILAPIGSKWAINVDARGDISVPLDRFHNTSSYYAGARYRIKDVVMSLGGAIGTVNGYSSADYSLIAGLMVMPSSRPEPIVQAPAPAPVVAKAVEPAPAPKPRVVFTAKELVITEEVKFEHAKAVLTASGQNLLDEVASVLKKNKRNFTSISIEGHTNKLGSDSYNLRLSKQRAASVREYLISRGIPAQLLTSIGYGESRPKLIPGLSPDAQLAADRRVEFKVSLDKTQMAKAAKAWEAKEKGEVVTEN
jgi:OOP family OmpA-OmpF porin